MHKDLNKTTRDKPNPVARVMDPSMSAEAQYQLGRKISRSTGHAAETAGCSGFALSVVAAATLLTIHSKIGLSWWWVFASILPISIGFALASVLTSHLDDDDHSHYVEASDLDESSRYLMFRAQEATRTILESGVYANDSLNQAVGEPTLRRHEWEAVISLRKISKLRSELESSTKGGSPGPITAAVLDSQRRALTVATNATTSRISELERYAAELSKADAAERDWRAAIKASGRNDQYLDLIAATAADEHAIAEIKGLTEQAAAAAQIYREHLYQASLAAQPLILPDAPQN